jgi:hypothetical protein
MVVLPLHVPGQLSRCSEQAVGWSSKESWIKGKASFSLPQRPDRLRDPCSLL